MPCWLGDKRNCCCVLGLLEESVLEGFVLEESSGLGTVMRTLSQTLGIWPFFTPKHAII